MARNTTTIQPEEVAKFTAMAETWWDERGPFKPLHRLNPVRVRYIRDQLIAHYGKDAEVPRPLKDIKILDVGCGGGLLCEPMARLGAAVTGVDASEKNIAIARLHAGQGGLQIEYCAQPVEELAGEQYDAVLAMEIVEHVADVPAFIAGLSQVVKPGGVLFMATMNRTMAAFAKAIVGAEYILRWLPRGTHDWHKFQQPAELEEALRQNGMELTELKGITYHPFRDEFRLSEDVSVNYMLLAVKPRKN